MVEHGCDVGHAVVKGSHEVTVPKLVSAGCELMMIWIERFLKGLGRLLSGTKKWR